MWCYARAPVTQLRILPILIVALALAAFGVTACGGSSASDQSAEELLKDTFGPDHEVKSGKLDVGIDLDIEGLRGLSEPVSIKLTGPFQSLGKESLPKFDLALALSAGGDSFTAGAVSTGEKGFLKIQGRAYDVGKRIFDQVEKGYVEAQKPSKGKKGTTLSSLGIDPSAWLTNPRKVGEEKVGGTDTVHVTAGIDVEKFLADVNKLLAKAGELGVAEAGAPVPEGLTDKQRRDIARAVKSAKLDVYPGADDKTLRRLTIAVELDVPGDVRKSVGGLTSGKIAFDLTIADLNEDQDIKAPASSRPLAELSEALGGLLGGGSGTGTGGASGGGSGTDGGAGSGAQSEYLECVQAAGNDIAKVQRCASLLNP
jgi:hypothetical protein